MLVYRPLVLTFADVSLLYDAPDDLRAVVAIGRRELVEGLLGEGVTSSVVRAGPACHVGSR